METAKIHTKARDRSLIGISDVNSDERSIRSEATLLVDRLKDGDAEAAAELLPLVYDQLRALAGSYFRRQSCDHTLVHQGRGLEGVVA